MQTRGLCLSYDSVERHMAIEKLVTRAGSEGQEKKYYRIRPARWYGGIVTADCVGCGLVCRFCWVRDEIMLRPAHVGKFYDPNEIADSLTSLARKRKLSQLRVSGGEPTIGKEHLLALLDQLQGKGYSFILETNGVLVAHDQNYARDLSEYDFVHVRVSLKGCDEQEFAMLTEARPEDFELQLDSLRNLKEANVSCHPSVMASFSSKQNLERLKKRLGKISPNLSDELEIEELILYPHVERRLRKFALKHPSAHRPSEVPPEQI